MRQLKRVALEILISIIILVLFFSGGYELIPPALQMVALKVVLVSVALLHAHAAGKLFFPSVSWTAKKILPAHMIRMALYVVIPYCYALGG